MPKLAVKSPAANDQAAALDETVAGISTGSGTLAKMLSWIRQPGAIVRGRPTLVAGVDSQFEPDSVAAEISAHLNGYLLANRAMLRADGLILPSTARALKGAFPEVDATLRSASATPAEALLAAEHLDGDSHRDALVAALDGFEQSTQFAWLVNAVAIRAAKRMLPFLEVAPSFSANVTAAGPSMTWSGRGSSITLPVDASSSPTSLHREVRSQITYFWRQALAQEAILVQTEFCQALAGEYGDESLAASYADPIRFAMQECAAIKKLASAADRLIDVPRIASTCEEVIAGMNRNAIRNAMRHGSQLLTWRHYLNHSREDMEPTLTAAEPLGALAYTQYSTEQLEALAVHFQADAAFGAMPGRPANDRPLQTPKEFSAAFTQRFVRELASNCSPPAVEALAAISPRYLSVLVSGHRSIRSLSALAREISPRQSEHELSDRGAAAGRRLGQALSKVCEDSSVKGARLPWLRTLSCDAAIELMLCARTDDVAATGLSKLFEYANHLRAKGASARDAAMPSADSVVAAPARNASVALATEHGTAPGRAKQFAAKAPHILIREFARAMGSVTTEVKAPLGETRAAVWTPRLGNPHSLYGRGSNHLSSINIVYHVPGELGGYYTNVEVLAWTNEGAPRPVNESKDADHLRFDLLSEGAVEGNEVVHFELRVNHKMMLNPAAPRFRNDDGTYHVREDEFDQGAAARPLVPNSGSPSNSAEAAQLSSHTPALLQSVATALEATVRRHPLQAAALLPAIAAHLMAGGRISATPPRALGTLASFRLARACLRTGNDRGMATTLLYSANPQATSTQGVSLLDMALDSADERVPRGALEGLRNNGKLATEAGAFQELVQRSMPKLVERHPDLIPAAIAGGAVLDARALESWEGLHPNRQRPESVAAVRAELMRQTLERIQGERIAAPAKNARRPV